MDKFLLSWRAFWTRPHVREILLWSVPALLVGFALRVVLTWQMPYGVYHDDTGDLLTTPHDWIERHKFQIHGKKTFLVPLVYLALALLRIPLLIAVPILQHLLGLLLVVLVGALCRLWFVRWRWFILPLTLIVAVNPPLLWYEHVLMAETPAVFSIVLVALAGTLYALRQSGLRLAFFCGALFLAAGARPEGKLLFGFGLFLVFLLHVRRWRAEWRPFVIMLVVAIATHFVTKTGQAGLLLYTSVVRLTPPDLKTAPGFEPYVQPLRADLQQRWRENLSFPQVKDRREVAAITTKYLEDQAHGGHFGHEDVDAFCLKLATETCRRNLLYLPYYALQKFRFATKESMAGSFNDTWLYERQETAFAENFAKPNAMPQRLTGRKLASQDEYKQFLREKYHPIYWYNQWQWKWLLAIDATRLPSEIRKTAGKKPIVIQQISVLFIVSLVGLLLAMWRRGVLQPLHVAWGITLLGLFFTIMLTANLRGRFRFVFEPFWYIYIALLVDTVLWWILPRRPSSATVEGSTHAGTSTGSNAPIPLASTP